MPHNLHTDQNRNRILTAQAKLLNHPFHKVLTRHSKTFLQDYTSSDKAYLTNKFSHFG